MGYFDDVVPSDTAPSYVATPPGVPRITVRPSFETGATRPPQDEGVEPSPALPQLDDMPAVVGLAPSLRAGGLFDDIVAPAMRVRPAGLPFGDSDEIVGQAAAPGKSVFFHDDDPIADNAARTGELAWHKAAIESALSNTVPLRLQHPRPVEIAAGLMADHGMPLDEALDRATMRLHAEEGTAETGKIRDIVGKDLFDEAQSVAADGRTAKFVGRAASPDFAPPAQGVGQGHGAAEEQARPDGEHASGDSAPQGEGAGGETIDGEDAALGEQRGQSKDEPASAAVEGDGRAERLTFGDGDEIVAPTSGEQHLLPTIERIGDEEYTQRAAHGELDPKQEEEPPDKGPPSEDRKQSDLPTAPRLQGGVSDSAAGATAIDFFNQLAVPELAESQALTDFVQQHPKAAAAQGALGLGIVLGIPAAGAAGLLGAAAAAARAAADPRNPFRLGPYAGDSILARSTAQKFTAAERAKVNRIGAKTGCHTCGTKNPGTKYGNFVLDHQTPSALNWEGALQRLYPQCLPCSKAQGLGIIRLLERLRGPR